jgi:biotin operon repressor
MLRPKKQPNIAQGIWRVALARNYGQADSLLDPKEKSILVALASYCSDATPQKTFVSIETLAYQTSWSVATVKRAIKELQRLGVISRQLRSRGLRSSRNTIVNWPLILANQLPSPYEVDEEDQPISDTDDLGMDNDTSVLDVIPAPGAAKKKVETVPAPAKVEPTRRPVKAFEFNLDDEEAADVVAKPVPTSPIVELVEKFRSEIPGHKSFRPIDYAQRVIRTLQQCASDCALSEPDLVEIANRIYKDAGTSTLVKTCGHLGAYLTVAIKNHLASAEAETPEESETRVIQISRVTLAQMAADPDTDHLPPWKRELLGEDFRLSTEDEADNFDADGLFAGRHIVGLDEHRPSEGAGDDALWIANPAADKTCAHCLDTEYQCFSWKLRDGSILTAQSDTPCEACTDPGQSYDASDYAEDAAHYADEPSRW